ncbi:uncharacterized protein J3R85_015626 [Psidium guajava]|nr:uncharacterized protein J3R85_015626 [Psidium guajava]
MRNDLGFSRTVGTIGNRPDNYKSFLHVLINKRSNVCAHYNALVCSPMV